MILIVDDKPENLFSLKSLLQLHAYEVDTASSGEEALRKILKTEYALVILDVQMPGMDGYEVAEAITGYSKTKNIPVIFLSAVNIDKRFITKGYASGGVDYVTKPFDPDLLLLKVRTFHRLYVQTKELRQAQQELQEEIERRKVAQQALEEANLSLEEKVAGRTHELLQANQKLELSNTELQQYASVASHDLQEPLRKITTFGGILTERLHIEEPDLRLYLKKIVLASGRMRNLINDLLNYSRLSSASVFVQSDLNEIIRETLDDLELPILEKEAQLIIDELPKAEVIPGQIRQAFQNIISNALKFSKKDEAPVIKISGRRTAQKAIDAPADAAGNYLRIAIEDNGIGFDEAYSRKIFDLFQRLHGREEYEGTGIGLAIVKKIVEQHNGLLSAGGEEGRGATFIMVLPLKQSVAVPLATA